MSVALTILNQLGGNRFIAMTGARNIVNGGSYLAFRIGRNNSKANMIRITLTARDDYTVELIAMGGFGATVIKTVEGVYADQLAAIFTAETGLATRL